VTFCARFVLLLNWSIVTLSHVCAIDLVLNVQVLKSLLPVSNATSTSAAEGDKSSTSTETLPSESSLSSVPSLPRTLSLPSSSSLASGVVIGSAGDIVKDALLTAIKTSEVITIHVLNYILDRIHVLVGTVRFTV
jgi:hypothetical protein